jgi:transposase
VVVDHESGHLVWAAGGRDQATVERFFDDLGAERAKLLTHVSADAASWISQVVERRCPGAIRCMDPFHVVAWATEALDQVRREVWNAARQREDGAGASDLKGARCALWRNADQLSDRQVAQLAQIEQTNQPLYRAYLLKEHLRLVFQLPFKQAVDLLEAWLEWAETSGLAPFERIARSIYEQLDPILASLRHGMSNAIVESVNSRIRLIARRAFGFHTADALIGLAMLSLGSYRPALPGRSA